MIEVNVSDNQAAVLLALDGRGSLALADIERQVRFMAGPVERSLMANEIRVILQTLVAHDLVERKTTRERWGADDDQHRKLDALDVDSWKDEREKYRLTVDGARRCGQIRTTRVR